MNILYLEDDPADVALLEACFKSEQISAKITAVSEPRDFQEALGRPELNLILSDFSLPRFDGLAALGTARQRRPDVPFIFLSGTIGEELAIKALREGATDYVLKDRMARLPSAIRRAMSDVEVMQQLRRDEEQLRNQAALLDQAQDAICLNNMDQTILYLNKSAERLYGWPAKEALGRNANELLFQQDMTAPIAALKSLIRAGEWQGELNQITRDGRKIIVESRWTLMRHEHGEPKSILIINTDITEKKQIEARLLRTQRVETIGALAGGIAHDLNNSLSPILMALDLVRNDVTSAEGRRFLDLAQTSAQRSIDMVRQILSFSRGVAGEQVRVPIQPLMNEVIKFVKDTFPRSIEIQGAFAPDLYSVNGNPTQLQQVLLNLCINARDAMPDGGSIRLEAVNFTIAESDSQAQAHAPGAYVLLTASDTGHGMSAEVLDRIFEPFFTTKEIGKGTGLGLSTVMGIIKTHGGFVEVTSEVGKGSVFRIFLPAIKPD